jgi:outer membrane protein assembly factor BamD (BamD/ComL family)
MNAQEARNNLIYAKQKFGRNEITIDELYDTADAYIEAIREWKKRTGDKKFKIPSRGYLIRAI